jgi:hypothetical protein
VKGPVKLMSNPESTNYCRVAQETRDSMDVYPFNELEDIHLTCGLAEGSGQGAARLCLYCKAPTRRMTNELGRIWKEAVMA